MSEIKFYYDTRACNSGKNASLKIAISHRSKRSLWTLGISGAKDDWSDSKKKFIKGDDLEFKNRLVQEKFNHAQKIMLEIVSNGKINEMTANDIRDMFNGEYDGGEKDRLHLIAGFKQSIDMRKGRTREIYHETLKRIVEFLTDGDYAVTEKMLEGTISSREQKQIRDSYFSMACDDKRVRLLKYEDVTVSWLRSFDSYLSKTSPSVNARAIHLRNIRSVFNDQLDDGNNIQYPFRKFKIRKEETVKRSLSPGQLRDFFNADIDDSIREYLDMFKLTFFLIGINTTDLVKLKEVVNGYIEYRRDKTHRLYNIKVEPEALEIINRYRGKKCLLNILDRYTDYKDYMQRINKNLKRIGTITYSVSTCRNHLPIREYHPMYPGITLYWARHSWATIASELDIPKEVISHALGHSMGSRTTAIYIDLDRRKVDVANRLVIDWVLYGKYTNWANAMVEMREEMFKMKSSQVNLNVV